MRVPRGRGPAQRRLPIVIALLLAASLLMPAGRASAAETFTFYGSGFGHGAGMSQWGSYGLASKGRAYREILRHYYRGVRIGDASTPASLRIGLIQARTVMHLEAMSAGVDLRVGSQSSADIATIPAGETWSVEVSAGKYVIRDDSGVPVGVPVGGPAAHLFAVYRPNDALLRLPEAGRTLNRGYLEINMYASDQLRAIAVLPFESYLYGLGEVPSSWPMAALKAQATAARTYALQKYVAGGRMAEECHCHLLASTFDQFYSGNDKEAGFMGARWVQAVDGTQGDVIRSDGALIQAFYHSSSGGITESSEHVFVEQLPYIRATCDPGDYTDANPNAVWEVGPMTAAQLTAELVGVTSDIGTVTGFRDQVREPSDRLAEVTVVGETGEAVITGDQLRFALGLKSTRVFINRNLNVVGKIRAAYDRHDCRPGSATTAARAVTGGRFQRFEKGAIYRNSEAPATAWLRGDTYDKFRALGEWDGRLGLPIAATKALKIRNCRRTSCSTTRFEQGRIFSKARANVGAHALRGPVLQHYVQLGGPRSALGFPMADSLRRHGPVVARFENGTIRCNQMGICRS